MQTKTKHHWVGRVGPLILGCLLMELSVTVIGFDAVAEEMVPSSYSPVVIHEDFDSIMNRMSAAKPSVMKEHLDLLQKRYDLSDKPLGSVTQPNGKPVQAGVRVKLPDGVSWQELTKMSP